MPIRKNLAVYTDPYLPWGAAKKVTVCKRCGAVYHRKHWSIGKASAVVRNKSVRFTICPACRKIQDRFPGGVLTLRGEFLRAHRDEILHLIRNEETRAEAVNPLERIISIKSGGDVLEIQTTTERFAQRIGREIERAYKGHAAYHWSRDNKFVRVDWGRVEAKSGK
jgi:NMD protein affecting ribosome stability and mRNA decay